MKNLLLICLALAAQLGWAQNTLMRGKIVDACTGEPLPFVNIVLNSETLKTGGATDFDGVFVINPVPTGEVEMVVLYSEYYSLSMQVRIIEGEFIYIELSLPPDPENTPYLDLFEQAYWCPSSVNVIDVSTRGCRIESPTIVYPTQQTEQDHYWLVNDRGHRYLIRRIANDDGVEFLGQGVRTITGWTKYLNGRFEDVCPAPPQNQY